MPNDFKPSPHQTISTQDIVDEILDYHPIEERWNALTHGLAALVAVIATALLCLQAYALSPSAGLTMLVYGLSMVLLFSASTFYHAATTMKRRAWLKKLDHTAIYYLIAGTYTPFLALYIPTTKAKVLLVALWSIALLGTFFKLYFIDRFEKLSLAAYIIMGWLALFILDDMHTYLSTLSLQLLILGGVLYTVGTIFYAMKKYTYTHVIWHVFVMLGALAHFFSIWVML
ncbi:hemolysin III [Acinetobacter marinus]|uniref:Hemolysin III n=1 Tax=Acinetobacter marinus TaxID=281375 RepID=A0A1G6GZW0_9GAMM|nr:hemolysin III family protein [Acinetobacter marinus]SDB87562.1 hemolysin III [Acinetobacter marinus]